MSGISSRCRSFFFGLFLYLRQENVYSLDSVFFYLVHNQAHMVRGCDTFPGLREAVKLFDDIPADGIIVLRFDLHGKHFI